MLKISFFLRTIQKIRYSILYLMEAVFYHVQGGIAGVCLFMLVSFNSKFQKFFMFLGLHKEIINGTRDYQLEDIMCC